MVAYVYLINYLDLSLENSEKRLLYLSVTTYECAVMI